MVRVPRSFAVLLVLAGCGPSTVSGDVGELEVLDEAAGEARTSPKVTHGRVVTRAPERSSKAEEADPPVTEDEPPVTDPPSEPPADPPSDPPSDPSTDPGPTVTLVDSGRVESHYEGQVIENLRITVAYGPALRLVHRNVVVRNVEVRHAAGIGIQVSGAPNALLENVVVEHTGAPASGANPSDDRNNIECQGSADLTVRHARLTRGSSGIYLVGCPRSKLHFIEGYDFRGPFPRGQLVQWNRSSDGLLEDFSVVNPPGSWPEDNVNVYQSTNVVIRRGHIDGNNSPSGVGVIADGDTATMLVEDVDAIRMGCGCFSAFAGTAATYRRTRCRENICVSQGRGAPTSNGLMWCGRPGYTGFRIEESQYFDSCNGNLVWPSASFDHIDLREVDFVMRPPLSQRMPWE
jgi:hypothetical protein